MNDRPTREEILAVPCYEGTDEPIPDGKYILIFRIDPFDVDKTVGAYMSDNTILEPEQPKEFTLLMSDYYYFRETDRWFVGKNRDGDHIERYNLDNVLYMECKPNSPAVQAAINARNYRLAREDDSLGRTLY